MTEVSRSHWQAAVDDIAPCQCVAYEDQDTCISSVWVGLMAARQPLKEVWVHDILRQSMGWFVDVAMSMGNHEKNVTVGYLYRPNGPLWVSS